MKVIQLLPIGSVEGELIEALGTGLPPLVGASCQVLRTALDPAPAFHGERLQYHSSELLRLMQRFVVPDCWRLLGIAAVDLYIPILTFVFGEAQLSGPCAIISSHRLRQEFYGLPADRELLRQRLLKEAVHELGHTLDLAHCQDYRCGMAPSHTVEWIDLKGSTLCAACGARASAHVEREQAASR